MEFNLDIKSAELDPEIAAQQVRKENAAFEPAFQFAAGNEYTKRPLNTRELLATGLQGTAGKDFNDRTTNYSVGIVGKLPTGAEYDLSFKGNRFKNDLNSPSSTIQPVSEAPPPSLFSPEYDSFAGLTLTQPLFRMGGIEVNMAAVNIAKADQRIAVIQRNRKAEEIALEITVRYCDLAFAVGEIEVRKEAVRLADSLAADNQRRLDKGVGSSVEILEAKAAGSSRADELELSVTRLIEVQAELSKLIGASQDNNPETLLPSTVGFLFNPTIDRGKLISSALQNRMDYRQAKIGIEKQDIEILYAKNQQWPQLDLKASCGVLGLDSSVTRAFTRASTGNNPFWSIGIVMTIPLGGNEATSQVQAALLKKVQAIMQLKKIEQDIVVDIDSQLRILQVHRRRIVSATAAVEFSQKRLEAEEQKMEKGTTTGFAILEGQRDLTSARTQVLSALADFNRSAAKLAFQRGTLLQDVGFKVAQ